MKEAAEATGVKLRWGAAWTIDDIGAWEGSAENAMNSYIDIRRSQGRRPFIDAPHFEVMFECTRSSSCRISATGANVN